MIIVVDSCVGSRVGRVGRCKGDAGAGLARLRSWIESEGVARQIKVEGGKEKALSFSAGNNKSHGRLRGAIVRLLLKLAHNS